MRKLQPQRAVQRRGVLWLEVSQRTEKLNKLRSWGESSRTPFLAFWPCFCPFWTARTTLPWVFSEQEGWHCGTLMCITFEAQRCLLLSLQHTIWTLYWTEKFFRPSVKPHWVGLSTTITNKSSRFDRKKEFMIPKWTCLIWNLYTGQTLFADT